MAWSNGIRGLSRSPRAERLCHATTAAVTGLQSLTDRSGVATPRFRAKLDTVYRAETLGYVSLYFVGGRTDKVELLVGPGTPPAESVGQVNTTNDINSSVGAIVRPGEYWLARSKNSSSACVCLFTPLF